MFEITFLSHISNYHWVKSHVRLDSGLELFVAPKNIFLITWVINLASSLKQVLIVFLLKFLIIVQII